VIKVDAGSAICHPFCNLPTLQIFLISEGGKLSKRERGGWKARKSERGRSRSRSRFFGFLEGENCLREKEVAGKRENLRGGERRDKRVMKMSVCVCHVHPIQKALADRVPDEPGIIEAPMGSGKPRMACKFLDRAVSKRVAALDEDVPGVLTIVVGTDAKHGREQAAQYGTDFPGPYHDTELGAVLRMLTLKGDSHAARIMIPFASFRKMCYKKKDGPWGIWDLLEKLGQPDVVLLIDEVTEVYKAANGRLPAAIDALRTIRARVPCFVPHALSYRLVPVAVVPKQLLAGLDARTVLYRGSLIDHFQKDGQNSQFLNFLRKCPLTNTPSYHSLTPSRPSCPPLVRAAPSS
jgi:hypothetical protein